MKIALCYIMSDLCILASIIVIVAGVHNHMRTLFIVLMGLLGAGTIAFILLADWIESRRLREEEEENETS